MKRKFTSRLSTHFAVSVKVLVSTLILVYRNNTAIFCNISSLMFEMLNFRLSIHINRRVEFTAHSNWLEYVVVYASIEFLVLEPPSSEDNESNRMISSFDLKLVT